MPYLQRLNVRPDSHKLSSSDARILSQRFDPYAGEVVINGAAIPWNSIEEIEVAKAARAAGPAGWFVKFFMFSGDDRYHVAFYAGAHEAVLSNLTLEAARYVVQSAAYYAPRPILYTGMDSLSPLTEV